MAEKPGRGASMVQTRATGPGMYQETYEWLNHASEFLKMRTEGLAGVARNSPTQQASLDSGERLG